MTRPLAELVRVRSLAADGLNVSEISRITAVPRATVRDWLNGRVRTAAHSARPCPVEQGPDALPGEPYAYLLGLYLGDGCISAYPRGVHALRIVQDAKYGNLITNCVAATSAVMPASKVAVRPMRRCAAVEVISYSKHWPCVFPQHGPGRKHERKIELTGWQRDLVEAHPEHLLRGLIHSDGCRVVNRVNGGDYPRYMFTQVSEDISGIFCMACELVGVRWTRTNSRTLAVSRRADVAFLDAFIGPKS